jgi:hypothetical protein
MLYKTPAQQQLKVEQPLLEQPVRDDQASNTVLIMLSFPAKPGEKPIRSVIQLSISVVITAKHTYSITRIDFRGRGGERRHGLKPDVEGGGGGVK